MPKSVAAPAGDGAVVEDGARVVVAGSDGGCSTTGAEVDGCAWRACISCVAVAELTIKIKPPAGDGAVVEDGARVRCAIGDFDCGATGAEVDGVAGCVGAGCIAVAELTIFVIAPTSDGAVVEERAGAVVIRTKFDWLSG